MGIQITMTLSRAGYWVQPQYWPSTFADGQQPKMSTWIYLLDYLRDPYVNININLYSVLMSNL